MPNILFVKSGKHETQVTNTISKDIHQSRCLIKSKELKYLGLNLPPIGVASHMAEYAGPDHVVLEVSKSDAIELGNMNPGYHLIKELKPNEVT
jgi:hypothetical protein